MNTKNKTLSIIIDSHGRQLAIADFDNQLINLKNEIAKVEKLKAVEVKFLNTPNAFHEIAVLFVKLLREAHNIYFIAPAIKESVQEFYEKEFKNSDELKEDIAKLLFRIYFSEGKDKVYDYNNKSYYNDRKCQALFDNGIYIPEEWLHQLLRCLVIKSAEEDMKLHNLTPEWMWGRAFRMLMELYQFTKHSIHKHG